MLNYINSTGLPTFTIIAWFSVVGFIGALIVRIVLHFTAFDIISWDKILPLSYIGWILLFLVGFLSFLGQVGLTTACKIENAGLVALIRSAFDIILSYLVQILIFGVSSFQIFISIHDFVLLLFNQKQAKYSKNFIITQTIFCILESSEQIWYLWNYFNIVGVVCFRYKEDTAREVTR